MKTLFITRKIMFTLVVFGVLLPVFGAEPQKSASDQRNTPITVNLIIDGTTELSGVQKEIEEWVQINIIDKFLQNGDKISIWSAGTSAQILYSETLKNGNEKENIKKILETLPSGGNSADFTGALRNAASQGRNQISYNLLITATPAALSPTLEDSGSNLVRFSRVEEHRGWRTLLIGLDMDSRVRQAASAYLSNR